MCAGAFREVECSVMGTSEPIASQPGEITYANEWYDYDAKYTEGGMELVVPARIDDALRERVRELAVEVLPAHRLAAAWRGPTLRRRRRVLVNELNTMPGFHRHERVREAVRGVGRAYPELLDRLCGFALERPRRRQDAQVLTRSTAPRRRLSQADVRRSRGRIEETPASEPSGTVTASRKRRGTATRRCRHHTRHPGQRVGLKTPRTTVCHR